MDPDRWARIRVVYEAADEADDPAAVLDALCRTPGGAPDADLRGEAEALLRADERFLEPSTLGDAARRALDDARDPAARRLGETLGPYRLDAVLGEGGMGVVYRAHDTRLGRDVAVKLVRSALGAPALVRRFEAERHMLARLDHPDIARLYDSGAAPDGTPFLVMEVVGGVPITEWADQHALPLRDRAALVERVARAVAFAQQRLVVHRDLKPSNVLVADGPDGGPRVTLLDFGVARLLDAEAGADVLTRTGPAPLTPAYAAPEQLHGEPATTATDVYSLGVLLYEMLAGRRPYETAGRSAAEVERLVTEAVPALPSQTAGRAPDRRGLRGDLDTICLKALAKDPARRYATAAEFADDLRRYLDGLPVAARPASVGYRTGAFIRRHRAGVAAAGLVALALVAGLVGTAWQAHAAAAQRDRAEHEARVAGRVSGFLQDMLAAADPDAEGRDVRVADVLDRAAAGLDTSFADDPAAASRLRQTLGATYRGLGLYDAAEPLLRRALADRRRLDAVSAAGDTATASVLSDLAYVLRLRGSLAGADSAGREALRIVRARYGERHPRTATAANDLAATARDRGDLAAAEALMRRALAVDRTLLRPDDPDLAIDYGNLASVLADRGEAAEAVALFRRALAIDRAAAGGAPSPDVALDLGNLGSALTDTGAFAEAERALREALTLRTRLLGPAHPGTLYTELRLARAVCAAGRPAEGLTLYDGALTGLQEALGPVHLRTAQGLSGRADCLARVGRGTSALADYTAAEHVWAGASPDHPGRADALVGQARVLAERGRPDAAAAALRSAVRLRRVALGPHDPRTAEAEQILARVISNG
ncbi:MAG TPA: serine/threonine-protein kinase [Rubricoccaceae bacterium]|jgi:serine/threonine-protein kinase